MIKTMIAVLLLSILIISSRAQNALPIKEWSSKASMPFVLYLSGDGGFNSFSTTLCDQINKAGYELTAINSKTYFWEKKTPEQTCQDISAYLEKKLQGQPVQQFILVGYSFGADVMPFIVNRLNTELKSKLNSVVLISPSLSTDFEIHWADMFGGNTKRSMDVVAEVNKMEVPKTITFFGEDEKDFPVKEVQLKNYKNQVLPGGHRFDGHTQQLAQNIIRDF